MNRVLKLIKHPLISGSSVILAASLFANIINYLFNLIMGRLLSPSDYGLMISLISVTLLFAIFQMSMTGVFAKFAAKFKARNDHAALATLTVSGFRLSLILSFIIFAVLVIATPLLSSFLHVEDVKLMLLVDVFIFFSILISLPYGIFQGQMKIFTYSLFNILAAFLKIGVAVLLVIWEWKTLGAMTGIAISGMITCIVATLVALSQNKKHLEGVDKVDNSMATEFRVYTIYFFMATLGITLFTSVDTILARHFFSPLLAGQYAALSLMGKAIFYITFPIYFVFFPLIAQRKEKKENVLEVLIFATLLILAISAFSSLVYFFYPNIILAIFFPKPEYKLLAPYLGPFSLYILVFSLASLISNFLLSIGKTGIYKINLFCGFLLIIGISIFHTNLSEVILALSCIAFLLLLMLLIYYWYNGRD